MYLYIQIIQQFYYQVEYHKRLFKPKIRLLSEAEYLDQSRVETEKALKNLRDYCQSPKCAPWKLTSRLESPTRFAEFVEGIIEPMLN